MDRQDGKDEDGIEIQIASPKVSSKEIRRASRFSDEIDSMIKSDQKIRNKTVTLLLLGTGGSGKSTIAKQMKIIHMKGFQNEERIGFIKIIRQNIVDAIQTLIKGANQLAISIKDTDALQRIISLGPDTLDMSAGLEIEALWNDEGIRKAFQQRNQFQLEESSPYFLNNVRRFFASDYVPNDQDILYSRAKTNGVVEIPFQIGDIPFHLIDVGGQRSQRSKWIHFFEGVTSVIFCASLSDYDLMLEEDEQVNRMDESITLFEEIVNSGWFKRTSMILFLNKRDLFEEKLERVNLSVCFPTYQDTSSPGKKDPSKALDFVSQQFLAQNYNKRKVYVHPTTATNTDNVSRVFWSVKEVLLNSAISEMGVAVY